MTATPQVRLSEALSTRIAESPTEATVAVMADEIRRQTQLKNPEEGLALAPSGWHPVRASFEVDKVRAERLKRVHVPNISGVGSLSIVLTWCGVSTENVPADASEAVCPLRLVLQDCMTSFAISEDGRLYSALQSSNTCALVDVGVSQGKAAWEFLLEEDTLRYAVMPEADWIVILSQGGSVHCLSYRQSLQCTYVRS